MADVAMEIWGKAAGVGQQRLILFCVLLCVRCRDNNCIPLGGGEEYFHVGTKSLQFGDADGNARP